MRAKGLVLLIAGAVAVSVVATAVALEATGEGKAIGPDTVYSGCLLSGRITKVRPKDTNPERCESVVNREGRVARYVTWNAAGVEGPMGPTGRAGGSGPQGPQGPQGRARPDWSAGRVRFRSHLLRRTGPEVVRWRVGVRCGYQDCDSQRGLPATHADGVWRQPHDFRGMPGRYNRCRRRIRNPPAQSSVYGARLHPRIDWHRGVAPSLLLAVLEFV